MSTLSDLSIDIQTRLMNGEEPDKVARDLEVPLDWVMVEVDNVAHQQAADAAELEEWLHMPRFG